MLLRLREKSVEVHDMNARPELRCCSRQRRCFAGPTEGNDLAFTHFFKPPGAAKPRAQPREAKRCERPRFAGGVGAAENRRKINLGCHTDDERSGRIILREKLNRKVGREARCLHRGACARIVGARPQFEEYRKMGCRDRRVLRECQRAKNVGLAQRKQSGVSAEQPRQKCRADMPDVKDEVAAFAQGGSFDSAGQLNEGQRATRFRRRCDPSVQKTCLFVIGARQAMQRHRSTAQVERVGKQFGRGGQGFGQRRRHPGKACRHCDSIAHPI